MTKSITILALACVLVAGSAVASILTRASIPAAGMAASLPDLKTVVANREAKQDKLTVASLTEAPAAVPAETPAAAPEAPAVTSGLSAAALAKQAAALVNVPLRQAYASSSDSDVEAAKVVATPAATIPAVVVEPAAQPKPKVAAVHPQPQKSYAFLSDAQIAGIKERLHLTSSQEYYWPGIEQALRGISRKIQAARLSNPNANAGSIDPDSEEVQQLKSAAMPLLFQLRDDQKEEVRKLARIIGLEKVASAI